MESGEGLDRLFFEFASEDRLGIMRILQEKGIRMQEIARKLDLTDTETCRQLQRLSEAKLVQKQPDGAYSVTPYAKLELYLAASLDFVYRNRDYFFDHDIFCLPYEFVNRLGELSSAEFCREVASGFNRVRKMVFDSEKYIWSMAEQVDTSHVEPTQAKISKGLDFKLLMHQELAKTFAYAKGNEVLSGSRYMEQIPVTLVINEKEATIVFRRHNGVMDYMGLFGTDEKFRKWCEDLFMYYWGRAERWCPGIQIK
jgi:predicted transcriptional regulator